MSFGVSRGFAGSDSGETFREVPANHRSGGLSLSIDAGGPADDGEGVNVSKEVDSRSSDSFVWVSETEPFRSDELAGEVALSARSDMLARLSTIIWPMLALRNALSF
jgi:hypothetical protein